MQKPSFFSSLVAGATGMAKGALVLGSLGMLAGCFIGATLGLTALSAGGMVAGIMTGAWIGADIGISVGALVGAVTGVVQNREGKEVSAQDLVNMNNIAFSRGVEIGRGNNVSQETVAELGTASRKFQDRLETQPSSGIRIAR